jgi:signal transduction histidine kinase
MGQSEIIIFLVTATIVFIILILGLLNFFFQYRKRRLHHLEDTKKMQALHQSELLATQLEMQTQTMQHIGREIHDNVGQKLTLASLYTQQLAYENKAPHINDKIENIGSIIDESLAELRQLSKSLTDDRINDNNIFQLLQQECDAVNELKKCDVIFSSNQHNIALPYQTKSIFVRITQEFLQNSMKHAFCKNIKVTLQKNENALVFILLDDGNGFDKNKVSCNGIGLSNMKKRTEVIGGKFNLESKPTKGTKLTIEIPMINNK